MQTDRQSELKNAFRGWMRGDISDTNLVWLIEETQNSLDVLNAFHAERPHAPLKAAIAALDARLHAMRKVQEMRNFMKA